MLHINFRQILDYICLRKEVFAKEFLHCLPVYLKPNAKNKRNSRERNDNQTRNPSRKNALGFTHVLFYTPLRLGSCCLLDIL